jgi:PAS domain S-box-containing protein
MSTPAPLSRKQFETVLDSISEAVVTIDREYVITSFNAAAEHATGCSREAALGRHCYEVLHRTVCDYISECPMTPLFENGTARAEVHLHDSPVGALRVSVHVLRNDRGDVVGGIEAILPNGRQAATVSPRSAGHRRGEPRLNILEASERSAIEDILRRNEWNRAEACRLLGLSRTTLWRKMRKLGIRPPAGK